MLAGIGSFSIIANILLSTPIGKAPDPQAGSIILQAIKDLYTLSF